jgi:hypothetical protein
MATKAAKNPWTKAQRAKLTAILRPNPNDPPDFIPTVAQAWAATGIDGAPPSKWTPEVERSLVERAWNGEARIDPVMHFLVATRGLEPAIAIVRRVLDPKGTRLGYGWFRRHLYVADEATFARVRALLTSTWHTLAFSTRASLAFTLSRDPSLGRGLVDALPKGPFDEFGRLMVAVGDAALARRIVGASRGKVQGFYDSFDLVEAYGGDAAPLLQGVLARFNGKDALRKPIEQALRLAVALAGQGVGAATAAPVASPVAATPVTSPVAAAPVTAAPVAAPVGAPAVATPAAATPIAAPVAASAEPPLPQEALYDFDEIALAGTFAKLDPRVIDLRLRARRLRKVGTPSRRTRALFAGAGASPELRRKAKERGIPVFGEAELEGLLATPLYRFRERFKAIVEDSLGYAAIHSWWIGAPATDAELAAAEASLGAPLDPALRAFYSQCNGVQLRADLEDPPDSGSHPTPKPRALPWNDVGSPYKGKLGQGTAGVVAILALDELVKTRGYGRNPIDAGRSERVKVGRRAVPMRTFLENMYLLDGWYDYYPVALFCDRERRSFEVMVGDDHGAVWDDPDAEGFEAYLESALDGSFMGRRHGRRRFRRAT